MASNGGTMASIGLLLLRVGMCTTLFAAHGWGKLVHFRERMGSFADPIHLGPVPSFWLVVFAEVFCTTFLALGLFSRAATVPLIGFFTIAFFIQHASDPFPRKELALVFLTAFTALFFTGPGKFALDSWMRVKFGPKGGD